LLERGAEDINTALLEPTAFTPIMAAAKFDKTDTVKVLVEHKADLTLRSGNYETVLEVAMTAGHFATVRILLEALGGPEYPLDTVALQMAMTNDYAAVRSLMTTAYLMFTELGLKEKVAGSLAWIGWVLEKGGDLVKQRAMSNMMHVALVDKNVTVLKELLLHGYDPNEPIATGHTLLTFAVGARDTKLVEFLLNAGADPSIPSRDPYGLNYTPLHQAIVNMDDSSEENVAHADIIMVLLASRRCRLMRGKRAGYTVFHYVLNQYANGVYGATENMSFKMIESVDDLLIDRSDDGSTLLHAAVTYGRQDLIDLLLTKGLKIDVTDDDGMTPFLQECRRDTNILPYLIRNGAGLHKKDHDGQGALHLAASSGRIQVLEVLLNHGMDVDLPTDDGVTPLSRAITSDREDAALFLLNRGATFHGKTTRHRRSFLHTAASLTMERLVDGLLARSVDRGEADINAQDHMGWTPLALAVRTGSVQFITTLLDAGADPAIAHDGGDAALHLALIGGNEPVALLLIERGVSCSARGMWDRTPLHLAAGNHNLLATRALLERGVEVDAIDDQGWTPLLLCSDCTYGDPEIIQLLVDHGADVNYKEPEYEGTPLYHALDRGSVEVFEVLVKAGADWKAETHGSDLSIVEMIEREGDEELKGQFLEVIKRVRKAEGGRESGKCEKREDRMKGILERGRGLGS
jgi:ankyrin repeat protein